MKSPELNWAEVEFLGEHETITVLPNFKEQKMFFLTGDFGPFTPGLPVDVPLWLALTLKQQNKCKIHPPSWLDVENLSETKENESNSDVFTKPPSMHYIGVASMLLKAAPEQIPQADEVRALIKDIWDIRLAKLHKSMNQMILVQEPHAQIDNITVAEMNQVRTLLLPALDEMHNMRCYVSQLPSTT